MRTSAKKKKSKGPVVRSLKIQPDVRGIGVERVWFPAIRLSGTWLEKLGFAPEMRVSVTTMDKLLIIGRKDRKSSSSNFKAVRSVERRLLAGMFNRKGRKGEAQRGGFFFALLCVSFASFAVLCFPNSFNRFPIHD